MAPGERGLEVLRAHAGAHRRGHFLQARRQQKVTAVNGTVVEDCNFRTGRRVLRIDGKVSADGSKTR